MVKKVGSGKHAACSHLISLILDCGLGDRQANIHLPDLATKLVPQEDSSSGVVPKTHHAIAEVVEPVPIGVHHR